MGKKNILATRIYVTNFLSVELALMLEEEITYVVH